MHEKMGSRLTLLLLATLVPALLASIIPEQFTGTQSYRVSQLHWVTDIRASQPFSRSRAVSCAGMHPLPTFA